MLKSKRLEKEGKMPLSYFFEHATSKIIEMNIPLEEGRELIKTGLYRLATPLERVSFIRNRPKQDEIQFVLPKGMLDVQFVSPRLGNDGYSTVGEFLIKHAYKHKVFLNRNFTGQKIGILYNYPYYHEQLKTPYKILYSAWESTKMPEDFGELAKKFDEIWAVSKFVADVWKEQFGIEAKIMYHGIDGEQFPYMERKRKKGDPVTFLHYDAFKWRKGWDLVINAFEQAFGDSKDVRLILKTATESSFPLDYPNVEVRKGKYNDRKMKDLLKECDAFVFPSRGEGFGMTPLEAMSTGLPTIVSIGHGHDDYINDKMYLVKSKRIKARYDNGRFVGMDLGDMFEADLEELTMQFKNVYNHIKTGSISNNGYESKWDIASLITQMTNRIKQIDKSYNLSPDRRPVQLSIIVLTYNALEYTKKCLESIAKNTKTDYEVIIIDNNSQDGTKAWLQNAPQRIFKKHPVSIIMNESNMGVAGGRNQGIQTSNGFYCVFLDNDTEVFEGWDERIISHFRQNPETWVVGHGGNYVDNFSPLIFRVPHGHLPVQAVDVVAGYCFAFPKSIIPLIGNQYEGLGKFWHEDLEFCMRVRKYGKQVILDTQIPIIHHGHKSGGNDCDSVEKIKKVHKGFDIKARMVGKRLADSNVLVIHRDTSDPYSAYTIIADNISPYLRDLGLVVLRKHKIANWHTKRSASFDLCNGFDMTFNGMSLTYQHSENNIVPKSWVDDFEKIDYALTCSPFSHKAMIDSGIPNEKLINVSLTGIQSQHFNWEVEPLSDEEWAKVVGENNKEKFVFFHAGASQPRKGTDILIKAFCEEFKPDEPVVLVIKNYNYGKHAWILQEISKYTDRASIIPIYEDWDASFLARVYKRVSQNGAYVSPHRAEGFGMTQLEAVSCGCRIGVTAFGGVVTTLEGIATFFDYSLVDSEFHNNAGEPFYSDGENPKWAEPNIDHVKDFMRKVYDSGYNEREARENSKKVVKEYSFKRRAEQLFEVLKGLKYERPTYTD